MRLEWLAEYVQEETWDGWILLDLRYRYGIWWITLTDLIYKIIRYLIKNWYFWILLITSAASTYSILFSYINHQATHNLLFSTASGLVFKYCGAPEVSNKEFLINVLTKDLYFIFNLVLQLFILHQMSLSLNQRNRLLLRPRQLLKNPNHQFQSQ